MPTERGTAIRHSGLLAVRGRKINRLGAHYPRRITTRMVDEMAARRAAFRPGAAGKIQGADFPKTLSR